jgi:hypothetical protein
MEVVVVFLFGFCAAIYVIIAVFAVAMTYDEQQRTGGRSLVMRILGFLACLFWPFTLAAIIISLRRARAKDEQELTDLV